MYYLVKILDYFILVLKKLKIKLKIIKENAVFYSFN